MTMKSKKRTTLKAVIAIICLIANIIVTIIAAFPKVIHMSAVQPPKQAASNLNPSPSQAVLSNNAQTQTYYKQYLSLFNLERTILLVLGGINIVSLIGRFFDNMEIDDVHESITSLNDRLGIKCQIMTRRDMYLRMRYVLETANSRWPQNTSTSFFDVHATSFLPGDPTKDSEEAVRQYHEALNFQLQNRRINVRRIASIPTPEKLLWITQRINEPVQNPGFSLRWHKASSFKDGDVVIPQNIQILFDEHVFILHPRTNYETPPCDRQLGLYIRSKDTANIFLSYYDRLWLACERHSIIEHGDFKNAVLTEIERHLAHPWRSSGVTNLRMALLEIFTNAPKMTKEGLTEILKSFDFETHSVMDHLSEPGSHSYGRTLLVKTTEVEIMLMNWAKDAESAPHDHGAVTSWIYVVAGSIENRFFDTTKGPPPKEVSTTLHNRESIFKIDPKVFHSMKATSDKTVTLHINVPPVEEMRIYDPNAAAIYVVTANCGAWMPDDKRQKLRDEGYNHSI